MLLGACHKEGISDSNVKPSTNTSASADDSDLIVTYDGKEVENGANLEITVGSTTGQIVVDGANGQNLLCADLKDAKVKLRPILPSVKEVINAGSTFESALFAHEIVHMGQPSLAQVVSNCEKRAIGSNGGFGYRSIKDGADISLLDSVILAVWSLNEERRKPQHTQKVSY